VLSSEARLGVSEEICPSSKSSSPDVSCLKTSLGDSSRAMSGSSLWIKREKSSDFSSSTKDKPPFVKQLKILSGGSQSSAEFSV